MFTSAKEDIAPCFQCPRGL